MKLTQVERLALWNQYEILKRLDPELSDYYERNQEIVSNGYELYYPELNQSIDPEGVSEAVCREVQDILGMFRAIKFSADRHGYTPKSHSARFEGFDGNESTGHFGFARFLRRTLGLWEELKNSPDNSHSAVSLHRYRRMLEQWRSIDDRYSLTPEQIEQISG